MSKIINALETLKSDERVLSVELMGGSKVVVKVTVQHILSS
jgi:hypothetical protein